MIHSLIMTAIIFLSLIFMTATVFSGAAPSRKWAAAAFTASAAYGAVSYLIPYCGTVQSFILAQAFALSAVAVMGVCYMCALGETGGVTLPRPLRLSAVCVALLYSVFMATSRIHGLCFSEISIKTLEIENSALETNIEATYKTSMIFLVVNCVMMAFIAFLAVYALIGMNKKLVKVSGTLKFLAVLSVILPFGFIAGETVGSIAVLAADLLLAVMVTKLDSADMVSFGKSCGIDSTNDGVVILDKKMNFLFANKTAKSVFLELSEKDPVKITQFVSTISDKESMERRDRVYSLKKGTYTDYNGNCDCNIIMIHDITEQNLRNTRLNEEAAIDSITGLNSRSSVIGILGDVCTEMSGSLLEISFDGFKAINNLCGHEQANKLLASFGTILKNNTNNDDVRGRLGGELFTVFLKNCSNESVISNLTMRLEEQITDVVRKELGDSNDISVGVSVGAAIVPDCGRDYETLSAIADEERKKIRSSGGHGYSVYHKEESKKSGSDGGDDSSSGDLGDELSELTL